MTPPDVRVDASGSGVVFRLIEDGALVDSWPMHIDPTPSERMCRAIGIWAWHQNIENVRLRDAVNAYRKITENRIPNVMASLRGGAQWADLLTPAERDAVAALDNEEA